MASVSYPRYQVISKGYELQKYNCAKPSGFNDWKSLSEKYSSWKLSGQK